MYLPKWIFVNASKEAASEAKSYNDLPSSDKDSP